MDTIDTILDVVSIFVAITSIIAGILPRILTVVAQRWRILQRYRLRWVHLPAKSMLDVSETKITTGLAAFFKSRPIRNLAQYQFILHNIGRAPLKVSSVKPFEWTSPSPILSARVVGTDPPVELSFKRAGNRLLITWDIFNHRCKALIEVLCDGTLIESEGKVGGQVENVPRVEEKWIYYIDEDERIRQFRQTLRYQSAPVRAVGALLINRRFRLVALWLIYAYLAIWLATIIYTLFRTQQIVGVAVIVVILTIIASLFFAYRNPYARFIRKVRANDKGHG